MNNPNLPAHAKTLERIANRLENEAKSLRAAAESLRAANVVVDPLFRAVQVAVEEAGK